VPISDDHDAVRSGREPDTGPSRQLIGDLIYECGHITHLPTVSRRCGQAIVNLARLIGINIPAEEAAAVQASLSA
jgi:hypothetical protein